MAAAATRSERFVGVLKRRGRFTVVEPLFERGGRVTVDARGRADVGLGDIALVRIGSGGRATLVRRLGRPDTARDVVEALLVYRGHARTFDSRVEEESGAAARAQDVGTRHDLSDLPTFTIDPAEARDFDDAISVQHEDDGFKLHVHIADVAAHVQAGSATEAEARRRGNSAYVPGTVEPMLPQVLSSQACSLVPNVPRRVVTVEMHVARDGQVRSTSYYRSLIRSDARMTYDDVELFFGGHRRPPEAVAEPLSHARSLASALRRRRLARGALGLETSEPEFEFDSAGNVLKAIDAEQTESHNVIEELMILANEQVAETLTRGRRSTLYRVHEPPEPTAIENLVAQLESLDVPTPPMPDHVTPQAAAKLVAEVGASVARHIERLGRGRVALTSLVLRSLKQAYYSPTNVGHAGLASSAYAHFTSPIRRFPDLVVHRSLLAAIGADESPPPPSDLSEIGWHCSQTEREAMNVEREADDICLAFLLERVLVEQGWDRSFEGEVTGLAPAGAFVSFVPGDEPAAACEGFLPARRLRGEFFELNEERTALVGRRTGRRLRLGDPVSIGVRSVDPPRGRVDLVPLSRQDDEAELKRDSAQLHEQE